MEFVIITGMSGAGKTTALHVLEDIGFYCVDNIPASLLPMLYTLCSKSEDTNMQRVAVVVDVRGTENYKMMNVALEQFKAAHKEVKILFFDAKTDLIIMRYKETRRRHPLAERLKDGSVAEAVEFEKALLVPVKNLADYHIDTSYMSIKQLRERHEPVYGKSFAGADAHVYVLRLQVWHSAGGGHDYGRSLPAQSVLHPRAQAADRA